MGYQTEKAQMGTTIPVCDRMGSNRVCGHGIASCPSIEILRCGMKRLSQCAKKVRVRIPLPEKPGSPQTTKRGKKGYSRKLKHRNLEWR